MMKRFLAIAISLLLTVFLGFSSAGAWTVSIEPVETVINPSDPFIADVYFNPDVGGNLFDAYNFDLGYDITELTWNSSTASEQNLEPPGWMELKPPFEDTPGSILNWSGVSFAGPIFVTSPLHLAAVEFSTSAGLSDGLDVWMQLGKFHIGAEGSNDQSTIVEYTGSDLDPYIVQGPDVAAVPIPSTMLLFLSGLVGTGISLRRKVV